MKNSRRFNARKTFLNIIAITTLSFGTNAQITINSTDLFEIGESFEQGVDTLPTGFTIGPNGASQVWDFSNIAEDRVDLISIENPTILPGYSNYTSSNMGYVNSESSDVYLFLTKNTSEIVFDGAYLNLNPFFAIPIDEKILTFPSTMGTNYSTTTLDKETTHYYPNIDPDQTGPLSLVYEVKVLSDIDITSTIDGWGDVTTPMGTFSSLRQIVLNEQTDTTYIRTAATPFWQPISAAYASALGLSQYGSSTKRTARWWTDNSAARFVLVEMDYQVNGAANQVFWLKSSSSVGISENALSSVVSSVVEIYPNPATSTLTIESNVKILTVDILDASGRKVKTVVPSNSTVDISELVSGIYFFHLYTENGNTIKKIIKE